MATPKKRVPLVARKSRADIQKAMENAERMETPNVTKEEGSARREALNTSPEPASPPPPAAAVTKKPIGRPPVKKGRTERLSTFLTENTKKRLVKATLQEKLLRLEKGENVDQSLIVEEALENWLQEHNY